MIYRVLSFAYTTLSACEAEKGYMTKISKEVMELPSPINYYELLDKKRSEKTEAEHIKKLGATEVTKNPVVQLLKQPQLFGTPAQTPMDK
jgi:hypothetical protein